MEAIVLAGLIGIGYLYKDSNDNDINITINDVNNRPNGDNVYNSGYYDETQNLIKSLVENNFEESNNPNSKIINNSINNKRYKNIPNNDDSNKTEGMSNYIYSNASGGMINKDTFLWNRY